MDALSILYNFDLYFVVEVPDDFNSAAGRQICDRLQVKYH